MLTRDVIIACDFASAEATFAFLDKFEQEPRKPFLKIGMELYYAEGPSIVREIKRRGHRIFLDLKLHDIPNTSTSEERMRGELLIDAPIDEVIVRYARNAREAGLDGVVCSPLEAGMVKQACGAEFLTVTPGVRFADGDMGDQVRVTTPARAREIGSDFIVVGRPVTAASDPVAAYRRCVAEFVGAE